VRCFQAGNPLLQFLDPCTGTSKQLLLDIKFFASYELEAAQSLCQDITKIFMKILACLRKTRRYQRCEALGQLVDTSHVHQNYPEFVC
jgi:hypothetical protein